MPLIVSDDELKYLELVHDQLVGIEDDVEYDELYDRVFTARGLQFDDGNIVTIEPVDGDHCVYSESQCRSRQEYRASLAEVAIALNFLLTTSGQAVLRYTP